MSRTDVTEILEICLRRMDAGAPIESVVADYPDHAGELREMLRIATVAQAAPSHIPAGAQANSRKRMLERAKALQEKRPAVSLWAGLLFLRRHLGSAALATAAIALLFIALSSTNALPGDQLYPVKLAAEWAELSMAGSEATRLEREAGFDMRRTEEVAQMIRDGRSGPVNFGGFLKQANEGLWQIAGVPLEVPAGLLQSTARYSQMFVEVTGILTKAGSVEISAIAPKIFTVRGVIETVADDGWEIDGQIIRVTASTTISGDPQKGRQVVIQAARVLGSGNLQALSAEVIQDPTLPAATETPTLAPTQMPAPSMTPQPTPTTARPAVVQETETPDTDDHDGSGEDSENHEGDSGDDHSEEETETPEDHSGKDDSGDGDHKGKSTDEPEDDIRHE